MAKIRLNRGELEKHMQLNEKTMNCINSFGTTIEDINSEEVEIEIPANRPDLLSIEGFARALNAFEGKKTGIKTYKIASSKEYRVEVDKKVKSIRPFTVCAVVKNCSFNEKNLQSMIILQEKLHATLGRNRKKCAIGVYPIEKIKFPVRYTALKPSQIVFAPLGSKEAMTAEQILKKHPAGKNYAELLKDAEHYPVFIDAANRILSMPPIINSEETGQVNAGTNGVFIECSGTDKETISKALIIMATSLAEQGGTIHSVTIKDSETYASPDMSPRKIKINKDNIANLIGIELSEKKLRILLARMGHDYANSIALVPAWRTDILHEVDLAEDAAIAYGYESLQPEIPQIATIGKESPLSKMHNNLREILNGLGLLELSSLHFITSNESERTAQKTIELENARTEYTKLRPNLKIPLLRALAENRDVEYPQNIYEIGKVFYPDAESSTGIREEEHLAIALTPANFTKAKQILDYLMKMLSMSCTLKEADKEFLVSGRTGSIIANSKNIGELGEVHPDTLRDWKLKMPAALIEINLEEIYKR